MGLALEECLKKKTLERNSLALEKSSVMHSNGLGLLFWPQRCALLCQQPSRKMDMVRRGRNKETVKKKKSRVILEQPQKNVKGMHISYCVCVYFLQVTHSHQNQEFQFFSGEKTDRIIFID